MEEIAVAPPTGIHLRIADYAENTEDVEIDLTHIRRTFTEWVQTYTESWMLERISALCILCSLCNP